MKTEAETIRAIANDIEQAYPNDAAKLREIADRLEGNADD